jgi:hypothetical protein
MKAYHQHWRGVPGIIVLKGAPVLEFVYLSNTDYGASTTVAR